MDRQSRIGILRTIAYCTTVSARIIEEVGIGRYFSERIGITDRYRLAIHPPIAGDNRYGYAIPKLIDRPIGTSIGIVHGARDVWL